MSSSRWTFDVILEIPVRLVRVELHVEFLLAERTEILCVRLAPERVVVRVGGETADAPAVDPVKRDIDDLHFGALQYVLDNRETVVLEMLVTDRVIGIHPEHHRHV